MSSKPTKLKFKGSTKRKSGALDNNNLKKQAIAVPTKESKDSKFCLDEYDFVEADDPKVRVRDEWMLTPGDVNNSPINKNVIDKYTREDLTEVNNPDPVDDLPAVSSLKPELKDQYDISYEFGDSGSSWRMMKLKKLYKTAQETGKPPEIVALERYGNLLDFDIAREEQAEMEARHDDPKHVPKYKPNGFFYHQREFEETELENHEKDVKPQLQQSNLNELRAKVLKAKLQKSLDYSKLEAEYKKMEQRLVSQVSTGLSEVQGTSSTAEMIIEERLTKSNKEFIKQSVKAIMKDTKFSVDLDEQDEKISSLADNLKNGKLKATGDLSGLKALNYQLTKCYLCPENNKPVPVLQQTEGLVLALAPHPAIVERSLMIFPKSHYSNSLQFDNEERHELQRIMICLSKFYFEKFNKKVIFYELSNGTNQHCSIMAIPIPLSIEDSLIFEYFQSAIIEESNDLNQQHKIIIDTRQKSYDSLISKEAPYFHLWLNLEGGIGHIIEEETWPRGDLFARRVIGGILKLDKFDVERKTRYYVANGVTDKELESMKELFKDYDWSIS